MALIRRAAPRRPQAATLRVAGITHLTPEAIAVRLTVPPEHRDAFAFRAGQHLTLRASIDGQDVRRSYSLCLTPAQAAQTGELRIGVARVPGGLLSGRLHDELVVGDDVESWPPMGDFVAVPTPATDPPRAQVALAAGSGITPVLSIVTTLLGETDDDVTLVYGNRSARSTMFADELADLRREYPGRFHLVSLTSREPGASPLLTGRLDEARTTAIIEALPRLTGAAATEAATGAATGAATEAATEATDVGQWYLCGPDGMVTSGRRALARLGVDASRVHHEVFFTPAELAPPAAAATTATPPAPATAPVDRPASGRESG